MADKPEALRLADALEGRAERAWTRAEVAAELRRLHDLFGKANALCRIRAVEIERLTNFLEGAIALCRIREAENAELLEVLRRIATVNAMDYEYQAWARAAIAKAEVK
jgi:hypothetical protein